MKSAVGKKGYASIPMLFLLVVCVLLSGRTALAAMAGNDTRLSTNVGIHGSNDMPGTKTENTTTTGRPTTYDSQLGNNRITDNTYYEFGYNSYTLGPVGPPQQYIHAWADNATTINWIAAGGNAVILNADGSVTGTATNMGSASTTTRNTFTMQGAGAQVSVTNLFIGYGTITLANGTVAAGSTISTQTSQGSASANANHWNLAGATINGILSATGASSSNWFDITAGTFASGSIRATNTGYNRYDVSGGNFGASAIGANAGIINNASTGAADFNITGGTYNASNIFNNTGTGQANYSITGGAFTATKAINNVNAGSVFFVINNANATGFNATSAIYNNNTGGTGTTANFVINNGNFSALKAIDSESTVQTNFTLNNGTFTNTSSVNIDGADTVNRFNGGTFAGAMDLTNTVANSAHSIYLAGTTITVDGKIQGTEDVDSTTLVEVTAGFMRGNTYAGDSANTININGGDSSGTYYGQAENSTLLDSFATFNLNTGIAKNLKGLSNANQDEVMTMTNKVVNVNGVFTQANGGSDVEQVVNMNMVNVGSASTTGRFLEIGRLDHSTRSQLTAQTMNVFAGNTFVIHEDGPSGIYGTTNINPVTPGGGGNIVNDMVVAGKATIDQTTIQGLGMNARYGINNYAHITVNSGGTLHGFGEPDTGNKPMRPNLIGDLVVKSGAKIQPYNPDLFDIVNFRFRGVTFQIKDNGTSGMGVTTMEQSSKLSTRLFADLDTRSLTTASDNTTHATSFSDSIQSFKFDFQQVYNGGTEVSQTQKVQYDPVFGFRYELVSKQAFEVYRGDGVDDTTYYYKLADSKTFNDIDEVKAYVNANHILNKNIIKSDMLGEWWFEKSPDNQEIGLRFRLLAEHPSKGGFAKDAITPNSRSAVTILDVWRYPFRTAYTSGLNLPVDPSEGMGYTKDGYDGDMQAFYAANPQYYSKYQPKYIADFEQYLLALQNESVSGHDLERSHRQIHAESYADLPGINLDVMGSFQDTVERVGMSNLYQVESDKPSDENVAIAGSTGALANLEGCVPQWVCNPIRFWASGFGATGRQNMKDTEYGYDTQNWGGAVGVVKEWGDWYFGLSGGYARVDTDWDDLKASAKTDAYLAEGRIGIHRGMGFFEIFGAYSYNDQKMQRTIRVADYAGDATGEYHDNVYGGGLRAGYQMPFGNCKWLFVPTVGVKYMRSENAAFTETPSRDDLSLALDFQKGNIERYNVTVPVMARLSRIFAFGGCNVITPEVRAAIIPIFGDKAGTATAEYVGMPIPDMYFESVGIDQGRFAGQLGATLEFSRRGRFWAAANYDYVFRNKSYAHNYSIQAGYNF